LKLNVAKSIYFIPATAKNTEMKRGNSSKIQECATLEPLLQGRM
jgi:hypothetical protein